jgi:SSS family solute:Na+ symporter
VLKFDLLVLVFYFAAVLGVGFLFSGKHKTLREFLLANRSMPWWAASLSGIATMLSAIGFLGAPGQAYAGDWRYLQLRLAVPGAILISTLIILPVFYRSGIYTAYEYLQNRFDKKTRLLGATVFSLLKLFYCGVAIFAPALVVTALTGWPIWSVILGIGALTTLYTTVGGIRAVIWTDALQMVVLTFGLFAALWVVSVKVGGGLPEIIQVAQENGKLHLFDFSLSPFTEFTFWGGLIGGTFFLVSQYAVDQAEIQRFLTTRSIRGCQAAMIWSLGINAIFGVLLFLVGTALWVFYFSKPEAMAGVPADGVFPKFILEEFPTGLRGLLIAGVFAAAMSTISSIFNSLATVFVRDLWPSSEEGEDSVRRAQWATLGFGLAATLIALNADSFGNILVGAGKIRSFFGGVIVGIFMLGMLNKKANGNGAFLGALAGFGSVLAVSVFTEVSWLWYCLLSAAVTYAAGVILSGLFPKSIHGHRQTLSD